MSITRDNDEERMVRIERILTRLAEDRVNSERLQAQARRMLHELHAARARRKSAVSTIQPVLTKRPARKSQARSQRSR